VAAGVTPVGASAVAFVLLAGIAATLLVVLRVRSGRLAAQP
jgi:hypothetical protein